MIIRVQSFIPYLENIKNEYHIEKQVSIKQFTDSLGVKWDEDALVVVNRTICLDHSFMLNDGDLVELLIPLSGG
ncbi:hypothetical protein H1D32_16640 [Anaerobacillus sp. CMMVII]|uniref:hypothetical protein n=1 Tax=Anaerobacillus sp. CMMVII TaxID=2755588 RepID=UPI0021B7D1E5|nr:hypothetical protein [Anaerobacillus sp. CMMVII]MCT8139188.1 hypothetical protein [Anaerobacillus sp. CMMVII]